MLLRAQLAADFGVWSMSLALVQGDLRTGSSISSGLSTMLHREGADLAALLVEFGAEVLLRLVILPGGYDDGILDRRHDDLRDRYPSRG